MSPIALRKPAMSSCMRRSHVSRHVRAFTLVEAIAAIVVLSIAVPSMMWAVRDAQMNRIDMLFASQARWLATEKLEDIIADRHASTRGYVFLLPANY